MCVEQNEMSKLGFEMSFRSLIQYWYLYHRTRYMYVEQNEMSKLGYNKERDEELQSQHKQLLREVRTIQDKLDTLEAK